MAKSDATYTGRSVGFNTMGPGRQPSFKPGTQARAIQDSRSIRSSQHSSDAAAAISARSAGNDKKAGHHEAKATEHDKAASLREFARDGNGKFA